MLHLKKSPLPGDELQPLDEYDVTRLAGISKYFHALFGDSCMFKSDCRDAIKLLNDKKRCDFND